jgi:apolipoprotein N-acyltransferase
MQWLLGPLVDKLNIPMSNFSHWPQLQKPLHAAGHAFAASICYEDAFPGEWRNQVPASGFLLNVSEDMWFGDSLAPHQRLQMARFRSLESGRPMVRASNNGLSSLIDWSGEVVAIAPQFQVAAVTASMQPRSGVTPYTLYGNYPVLMLMAALGVLGMLFGGRKPGSP